MDEITKGSVTSVSVSPLMTELLEKYKFSPTEVFRRGMAIMLYEEGERAFTNPKNKERVEIVKKLMEELEATEKIDKIKGVLNG